MKEHPDVIRLRKQLAEQKARIDKLFASIKKPKRKMGPPSKKQLEHRKWFAEKYGKK